MSVYEAQTRTKHSVFSLTTTRSTACLSSGLAATWIFIRFFSYIDRERYTNRDDWSDVGIQVELLPKRYDGRAISNNLPRRRATSDLVCNMTHSCNPFKSYLTAPKSAQSHSSLSTLQKQVSASHSGYSDKCILYGFIG